MEGVAQLDIEVGICEQDTHIQEIVLRAVQRLGFADPRPRQLRPSFKEKVVLPYA